MPEVTLTFHGDFDTLVGRLNALLLFEKDETLVSDQRKSALFKRLRQATNAKTAALTIRELIDREQTSYLSAKRIFASIAPLRNTKKSSKPFGGQDIVIGLQGTTFSYRVDYDEVKGLHINIELNDAVKLAVKVNAVSSRFSIPDALIPTAEDQKNAFRAEFIKYKFWVKMTLGYFITINDLVSACALFLKNEMYEFEAFKEALGYFLIDNEAALTLLNSCQDEAALIKTIFGNATLRDLVINRLISSFNNKFNLESMAHEDNDQGSEGNLTPTFP
ncbi:MAG: hypothetical protein A3E87_07445 [Gammaproteobacteria bacterium RIFCSPHIGHO2_12_FULL_35_23]|nr:MAG: hypothetical protein A3E87_07445 [Gammaproteobacteria bacterium RIFCSPHIGHO2_12_FULL_35_23]